MQHLRYGVRHFFASNNHKFFYNFPFQSQYPNFVLTFRKREAVTSKAYLFKKTFSVDYREILERLEDGYNEGVEILFNTYADSFYGYAVDRWNFTEDEAWDAVYQTLDKLLDRLPQCEFSNQSQFDAYVFTVFKSYLSKGYRRKSRLRQKMSIVSIEEATEGQISHESLSSIGFDEAFVRHFLEDEKKSDPRLEILREAMAELSEQDQQLLLLRVQNYTYDEIAGMLKIENNQLKVNHYRAKARLVKQMEKRKIIQSDETKI